MHASAPAPARRRTPLPARGLAAALAALALLVTGLVASTATAQAPAPERIADVAEPTAFSVALSQRVFDEAGSPGVTATHAALGRDDVFADSLAAGPLLGGGPLLYVPGGPEGALPDAVAAELQRILPPGSPVYLAGGADAVSTAIEQAVDALGYVSVRAGGDERTATAAAIAEEAVRLLEGTGGAPSPDTVLIARAGDWPDAIAGAALAASEGFPILLTDGEEPSPAAVDFLAAHPGAERVVLGGDAVISDAVADELGATRRLAGDTRVATAAAVAGAFPADVRGSTLANGYPGDGWVAGNAAATLLQPLLLTGPAAEPLPDVVRAALAGRDGELLVLGGADRISDAAMAAADDARREGGR